ncbi:MAG: glycosyltransferase family 4 protein [Duncaniella sp.]|nr:glycosyltransferase family 4 protein [Duncaniella sp.]
MRIGFDGKKAVSNLTGIGNYSRGIINLTVAAGNEAVVFAPTEGSVKCRAGLNDSPLIEYHIHDCHNALSREWWRNKGITKDIASTGLDIFHGLSNELPVGIEKTGVKSVVTIHDLIFLRLPSTYSAIDRAILKNKTLRACRNANRIIAISEKTKSDIVELYHIPEEKIEVIYQGCHDLFYHPASAQMRADVRKKYGLPDTYMISVGTIEYRKNHEAIIEAMAMTKSKLPLVIVSKKTHLQEKLREKAERLGMADRVIFLNDVPLQDLPALYQMALMALYVSRYEGFGIPVIEALASGTPVVAATGSCLEEAGGKGAIYCDPDDINAIGKAIDDIASSPELFRQLVDLGQKHIRKFSAENLAQSMADFYKRLADD